MEAVIDLRNLLRGYVPVMGQTANVYFVQSAVRARGLAISF